MKFSISGRFTYVMVGVTAYLLDYRELASIMLFIGVILMLGKMVVHRYGEHTIACFVGKHSWCDQHLKCSCPHHDHHIMEEMHKAPST